MVVLIFYLKLVDWSMRFVGEFRDWFFQDYLTAADRPLPFSFFSTNSIDYKKQIELEVLHFLNSINRQARLTSENTLDCKLHVE